MEIKLNNDLSAERRPLEKKPSITDKEIFKDISKGHWEDFKAQNPGYNTAHYEEAAQKMFGCGEEFGEYRECN